MAAESKNKGEVARLDADAWIRAALIMLAKQGSTGISIEVLARHLKVTKGSFYWHFKDRDALLNAMLNCWRQTATLELIDLLDTALRDPRDRLKALLALSTREIRGGQVAEVELSIRMWGRSDARARFALAEIDELRTRYIAQLLARCGISADEARARAILAYAYIRVGSTLVDHDDEALMDRCEAILLGDRLG